MSQYTTWRRRRRCYIDRALQGPLLAGLLLFELLLLSAALLLLQHNLTTAVEEQMYRAHQLPGSALPLLVEELLWVGLWLVGINVVAIALMAQLWSGMVRRVVNPLQQMLGAVAQLDLRPTEGVCAEHEVLQQAELWLRLEHERCSQIHALVAQLDSGSTADGLHATLQALRRLTSVSGSTTQ